MDRRAFLKLAGVAGGTLAGTTVGAHGPPSSKEFVGVLVDTTRCIGCRACEVACAETHGLPVPDVANDSALETVRQTSEQRLSVVNRYATDKGTVYVKKQCMHCWQPACGAACLTNAMYKTKEGPVIWREEKCMGCRFCMVSCPFEIPKFEYDEWNPKIQKCDMCWERLEQGEQPACVQACPVDALMFGLKRQVIENARTRIYSHPDSYVHHIYGEDEVGGTGFLYLSAVPFEQIGFRTDLGTTPYPQLTREFLYAVPLVFILAPSLLFAMNRLIGRPGEAPGEENEGS